VWKEKRERERERERERDRERGRERERERETFSSSSLGIYWTLPLKKNNEYTLYSSKPIFEIRGH